MCLIFPNYSWPPISSKPINHYTITTQPSTFTFLQLHRRQTTNMKQFSYVIALALMAASSSAFVTSPIISTPTTQSTSTSCNVWKKSVQDRRRNAEKPKPRMPRAIKEFGDPESEQMKEMLDIVGINRVKRAARKQKRVRNQLIREGMIELNEEGQWVRKK